mmetsp:Transcript_5136/g.7974  ORF Transcript_5136/g.7974 Transcript_5136/m.7974 type:complete len:260 (-) Transcript_5136:83-862(-)
MLQDHAFANTRVLFPKRALILASLQYQRQHPYPRHILTPYLDCPQASAMVLLLSSSLETNDDGVPSDLLHLFGPVHLFDVFVGRAMHQFQHQLRADVRSPKRSPCGALTGLQPRKQQHRHRTLLQSHLHRLHHPLNSSMQQLPAEQYHHHPLQHRHCQLHPRWERPCFYNLRRYSHGLKASSCFDCALSRVAPSGPRLQALDRSRSLNLPYLTQNLPREQIQLCDQGHRRWSQRRLPVMMAAECQVFHQSWLIPSPSCS